MSKTRILTSASIVALYAASTLSAAQAQSMDALIKAAKEGPTHHDRPAA